MASKCSNQSALFLGSVLACMAGCKGGPAHHGLPHDSNVAASSPPPHALVTPGADLADIERDVLSLGDSFEGRIYYDQLVYKSSEEEQNGALNLDRIKTRKIDRTVTLAIRGNQARLDTTDAQATLRCQRQSRSMSPPGRCLPQYQVFDSASQIFRLVDPNLKTVLESYPTRRAPPPEPEEIISGPPAEVGGIPCQRWTVRRTSGVPEVSLCLVNGVRGDVLLVGSYVSDVSVLSRSAPVLPLEAVGLAAGKIVSYLVINRVVPEALPEELFAVPSGYVIHQSVFTQKAQPGD